jgi:hypothetical protein
VPLRAPLLLDTLQAHAKPTIENRRLDQKLAKTGLLAESLV